jgi:hypothetical protein
MVVILETSNLPTNSKFAALLAFFYFIFEAEGYFLYIVHDLVGLTSKADVVEYEITNNFF